MMNNILGQFGLGGRLADNIRERQGMAYYAFSSFDPTVGEGPLVVRAGVDPKNVDRAIAAIDAEVRQLGEQGPTAARARGDPRLPDRIDPAAARNELQHRRLSAEGASSSDWGWITTGGCRASRVSHDRRVAAAAAEVLSPDRAAVADCGARAGRRGRT